LRSAIVDRLADISLAATTGGHQADMGIIRNATQKEPVSAFHELSGYRTFPECPRQAGKQGLGDSRL